MTTILQATSDYETWLAAHCRVVRADLATKREAMADTAFRFLRATYYRWAQLFPEVCPELASAPRVLSVGDVHVENYGTWRDAEGRLIWGLNDFDEAWPLPYLNDLIRLAVSAWLASEADHLPLTPAAAFDAVWEGFDDALLNGCEPYVLSERHRWLRDAVTGVARDPARFWERLEAQPLARDVSPAVRTLLARSMPARGVRFAVRHRQAGLGSLGRPRFTAVADWCGGKIAREAKALLPSAAAWARGETGETKIFYGQIVQQAIRATDPFLTVQENWVVRRLSPYCSRIELRQMSAGRDREKILRAMGRELGNIHAGAKRVIGAVRRDWKRRDPKTIRAAVGRMAEATRDEWRQWREARTA